MKYNYDKIFISAIILIIIVSIFLYKTYSVNLQKEKEKEVISSQLLKEKEIIKEKEKVDEKKKEGEQIEKERQRELLNSCLQITLDYFEKASEQILVPMYNQCVEVGNKFPSLGSECLDSLSDRRDEVNNYVDKSEANCYKKYPQE